MSVKTKWVIDVPHSEIGFRVRHLMITSVKGVFKEYKASVYTTGEDFLTTEIDFWMDPNSIDTRDAHRDNHLRSTDFFDATHYKEITFQSKSISGEGKNGNYELWGDLTIKGITRKIKLDVKMEGMATDPTGSRKAGFIISGDINRKDWDINWNTPLDGGGVLVGETVSIHCEVELMKQKEINEEVG